MRQFGFRKLKSRIDAISKLTTNVFDKIRREDKTAAIFFDIRKAYDEINRNKTFKQLENMGIHGRMMEFIREMISDRWIKMGVGGSISQNKQADLRVPQKSTKCDSLPGSN